MSESVWAAWFVALGLIVMSVVIYTTDLTTTNEQDYVMIKEVTEASMLESVDYAYYRKYGELRIASEKFMENFIRRYSEVVTINKTVNIRFASIYEAPPKVTVEVSSYASQNIAYDSDMAYTRIKNRIDAILEMYPN